MGRVEFCDKCWGMYTCGILPAIVFVTVPFPMDEVLELSPEYTAVQYGLNFIVFLSFN